MEAVILRSDSSENIERTNLAAIETELATFHQLVLVCEGEEEDFKKHVLATLQGTDKSKVMASS
jgi:hypothetical protein